MSLQQVQIDGRVLQSLMSLQQLNGAQLCTSFDQMRGEAMHKHDHTEIRYHSYILSESSRRLEAECHRKVELMWLLQRLYPDHKPIYSTHGDICTRALYCTFMECQIGTNGPVARLRSALVATYRLDLQANPEPIPTNFFDTAPCPASASIPKALRREIPMSLLPSNLEKCFR
jgi:hypothetical protein